MREGLLGLLDAAPRGAACAGERCGGQEADLGREAGGAARVADGVLGEETVAVDAAVAGYVGAIFFEISNIRYVYKT